MLKDIRKNFLNKDKESVKMNKKLLYAIEKLNSKRSLFTIENNVNFSDDEEQGEFLLPKSPFIRTKSMTKTNGSFKRRHSV